MKYTIIGAGIGGLTTALAFERAGIDYQVFERASEFKTIGAGIWLAPNALQVLDQLELLEQVLEKGNSIDRITLGKSDLTPLSDNPQQVFKSTFGYSTIAIHRSELQNILFEAIPKSKIIFNKEFLSYTELENKKIRISFSDRSKIDTDYLIGADGIHSKIRKQLFPDSKTRYSGQTCWRGIAHIELDFEYQNRGMELWGNQIRFGISKVSKGKVYWFAVALSKPNQKDVNINIQHKLLDMFKEFHPLVTEIISATPHNNILRNDISDLKPMDSWYKNRICLIGDAGHATTPNMGQGGAQAIEDAHYLSSIIKAHSPNDAFELFLKKRQAKVNGIVSQSWITGKMAHWKYASGLRNLLLKHIPKSFLEKKAASIYRID